MAPPPGNGAAAQPTEATDVLRLVQQSYANTANQTEACCVSVDPSLIGYTPEQILAAGKDSNLGLGCGNPLSFANLQKGETVVDLGSGAGIDCFLAAGPVGRTGTVIGVDMTPEMVHKARSNATGRGAAASRVSFRLGEIENLPVADGAADCVMSNCVINLSPDKGRVFREIHRILRDGEGWRLPTSSSGPRGSSRNGSRRPRPWPAESAGRPRRRPLSSIWRRRDS